MTKGNVPFNITSVHQNLLAELIDAGCSMLVVPEEVVSLGVVSEVQMPSTMFGIETRLRTGRAGAAIGHA